MLRILIIGILLMTVWLSVSLAIVAAAPYLAAFMVVAVLMFLLSKGNKKDPPTI